jgi:gluconolactonase
MNEIEVIAEGLAFPEGPVIMADGSVIVVEIMAGRVTRCWKGRSETICEPGGGPNGAAIGPDGALYVCNNGGLGHAGGPTQPGRIERVDLATGKVDVVYDTCDGKPLSAPNDLMFDCDGQMWFTDLGKMHEDTKDMGGLYCASPDGSRIVRIKARAFSYNGVGISPDMTTVYAADTFSAPSTGASRNRKAATSRPARATSCSTAWRWRHQATSASRRSARASRP